MKDPNLVKTVNERLKDYKDKDKDITKIRNKLVAEWKKHYPEAAKETYTGIRPLIEIERNKNKTHIDEPDSVWANDIYTVTFRWFHVDPVFNSEEGMILLGISSLDGTARHDWRDFQAIKNQLAGIECEAFELYPAESRLLDPSNYYALWCFPGLKRINIGQNFRRVYEPDEALAPQRATNNKLRRLKEP